MELLTSYGWNDEFEESWQSLKLNDLKPARVVADFGTSVKLAPQMIPAEISGKLAHHSNRESAPKVGDWVAVRLSDNGHAVVEAVVPRHSEIARKVAGKRTVKQTIAANVDVAFVLLAVGSDFSVERLKRFLYQLSVNNISPVIVLNKADTTNDLRSYVDQLGEFDLPIIISTATTGQGIDEIIDHIKVGQTAALLGSSGVGKSTLTNRLLGREAQLTQAVRESDATGRHTTVHRELFMLPSGGMLVDMPGIRELQLWGTEEDLDDNFEDVATLVAACKYTTCRHETEDGCAVRAAIEDGTLLPSRYASYVKMKTELVGLKEKNAVRMRLDNQKSRRDKKRQARDTARDIREEMS